MLAEQPEAACCWTCALHPPTMHGGLHSCLRAHAAIVADIRPQLRTHITGCCVRMSVTLGRCTSWGY